MIIQTFNTKMFPYGFSIFKIMVRPNSFLRVARREFASISIFASTSHEIYSWNYIRFWCAHRLRLSVSNVKKQIQNK